MDVLIERCAGIIPPAVTVVGMESTGDLEVIEVRSACTLAGRPAPRPPARSTRRRSRRPPGRRPSSQRRTG